MRMACVFVFCAPFFSLSQLYPSIHSTIASILHLLFIFTSSHCSMHYCPNPSCKRNLRNSRKPFACAKSLSSHVQQTPECKLFLLNQTALIAPTMQAPSKRSSTKTTAQLFKKQRLRLNPTFAQEEHTNNTNTHSSNTGTNAHSNTKADACTNKN